MSSKKKIKVAIIGTGNIGTDLLMKIRRSAVLDCTLFSGRNFNSPTIKKASDLGIVVSDRGIDAIVSNPGICDLVFDATSAQAHVEHWEILKRMGKCVIDMTPARLGAFCVPAISSEENFSIGQAININMITCGGQASIPMAYALANVHKCIDYVEVASSIASRSAGPATRFNLDEYIQTTEEALQIFSHAKHTKAILILNPATPPIDMQTTIYAKIHQPDMSAIRLSVDAMVSKIKMYVPGYALIVPPVLEEGKIVMTIKVKGNGDFLPQYAGNLDIINCAAIAIAERLASNWN